MNATPSSTPVKDKRSLRFFLLIVIPLLAVCVGTYLYLQGGRFVATDNAYIKADKVPISTEVAGIVEQVFVEENQTVQAGDLLYRLQPAAFEVAVTKARAKLAETRTELAALKASYFTQQAELELAQSQFDYAKKQQARQQDLRKQDYVSVSQLDEAEQTSRLAQLRIAAAQKDLQRIAEALGGNPDVDIEQHPLYQSAQAELEDAQLNLSWTEVRAPAEGFVSMPPKQGQHVNAGVATMVLVASNNLWIEANFTETDLTHIRIGQAVTVRVDTYPDVEWLGSVASLSPATGAEFSLLPAQNVTGNWVKISQRVPVRIALTLPATAPQLRAGMSAETTIDTDHRRSLLGLTL